MSALGIKGIPESYSRGPRNFCRSSVVSRSTKVDISRGSTRDRDPESCFHIMVVNIWGPVSCPSIGNFSYVLGAVCFKSAFIMAELLKCKFDSVKVFHTFLNKIQLLGYKVGVLRIDNDSVFLGSDFQSMCQEFDIVVKRSVTYRHHQLGKTERQWRTLSDTIIALMDDSMLDKRF